MANNHQLILSKHDILTVSGALTFSTVQKLWENSLPILKNLTEITIDLKNITNYDSAALALLIEWQYFAKKHNKLITFQNIPKKMLSIAKVSQIDQTLNFI